MNNEPKKISFGFSNTIKKPNIVNKKPIEESKVQLIEYVEEKSIKIIGNDKEKEPLIIPMKQSTSKLTNLIDIIKNDFKDNLEEQTQETVKKEITENQNNDTLSIEEQAVKELMNDSKNVEIKNENKRVIDVPNEEKLIFEGEKEPTLEDYENIPIEEFGKAVLRGMGWKDGQGIGKNEQIVKMKQPVMRPKGMGLGADKITKQENVKPALDRDGQPLKCVKGAFVKVIAGYHKGSYGQIIGLDDESGRFIIKTAINNINISLNEFLVTPVHKDEYMKKAKIINSAKYEEYLKKIELETKIKQESSKYSVNEDYTDTKVKIKKYSDCSTDEEDKKHKIKNERYESNSERKDKNRSSDKRQKFSETNSDEESYKNSRKDKRNHELNKSKYDIKEDKEKTKYKYSKYDDSDYERNSSKRKSSKYDDFDYERNSSKRKSSKYDDSSSEENSKSYRKKHKKRKKKYCSEDSEDYKKTSKKKDYKKYSDSESENKKYKKEKYRSERRHKHDKNRK